MNIFVLHTNPKTAAKQHVDKHVVKMILESAQMLSTAHVLLDDNQIGYKATHKNHPCSIWVRESSGNYMWLYNLFKELSAEYTYRYGKVHKTWEKLGTVLSTPPANIKQGRRTKFALAMPDKYKSNDPVQSYHDYYIGEKYNMFSWKNRPTPSWL